jgi:hypothetical protein
MSLWRETREKGIKSEQANSIHGVIYHICFLWLRIEIWTVAMLQVSLS